MLCLLKSAKMFGIVVAMAVSMFQTMPAQAETARIHLHIGKVGFVIGVSGGNGTLYHDGIAYPLTIGGLRVGLTIGASSADLVGTVSNLSAPADIEGTYTAAEGSVAFGGGVQSWVLTNQNGVKLEVHGNQVGFDASLDVGGMSIRLK